MLTGADLRMPEKAKPIRRPRKKGRKKSGAVGKMRGKSSDSRRHGDAARLNEATRQYLSPDKFGVNAVHSTAKKLVAVVEGFVALKPAMEVACTRVCDCQYEFVCLFVFLDIISDRFYYIYLLETLAVSTTGCTDRAQGQSLCTGQAKPGRGCT